MYLIPQPQKIEYGEGSFIVSYEGYLAVETSCAYKLTQQARLAAKELEKELGFALAVTSGAGRAGDIILHQTEADEIQGYCLKIEKDRILITGGAAGIWYGLQTLRQIVEQYGAVLPVLTIEDQPDIANRGFYHDATRGRIPTMKFLKHLVDEMAYYKLNQLQLYVEHTYLFRDLSELWCDDTPLTAEEILELDQYCSQRNVELVPSLSSFGHLYKLLSTRSYSHLCELEGYEDKPFSVIGRMLHHTMDVSNPDGIALVKRMIGEFMPLFTSKLFNICADETFDLGKGRSKKLAEEKGVHRIYVDYVKELCEFVVENGKIPMFWGDIICGSPELIKELPPETICLNWGYAPDQREDESRMLKEAGAIQYSCPGAGGWNHLVYPLEDSYNNIMRMATYAVKYGSIGLLNTDWGDFLHVNHPEFGIVGMIYGAAFSWNSSIPAFDEMNRQISRVTFGDKSGQFVSVIARTQECAAYNWGMTALFMEWKEQGERRAENEEYMRKNAKGMEDVSAKDAELLRIKEDLYTAVSQLGGKRRGDIKAYLVAVDGMLLFNQVGRVVYNQEFGTEFEDMPDRRKLAEKLEKWLYHYKEIYRSVSREGELYRIQALILWYSDYLRK